jgi:hypothetical protein
MRGRFRNAVAALAAASAFFGATAFGQPAGVPDFSGQWSHGVPDQEYENPAEGGPGPTRNIVGQERWRGDYTNPNLKPWVAERVRGNNEVFNTIDQARTAQERCALYGVPNILTSLGTMQMLQTPDMVTFIFHRDHQTRRVYLNEKHPAGLKPSWYGHSVGHYEGDTLVIDTVGLNDQTWTDRFGTPHTDQIHVVERYRLIDNGQVLEVRFNVEDPGAFNAPWSAVLKYRRNQNEYEEVRCAENNRAIGMGDTFTIPTDETPDF